ncbi:cytochrome b-c1 complex subunit 9 [Diaphorina citri]|uniref:Complex III subunit 9 n=1 Tax=Diaphorina citri TaxID=121845 RepID=A0A1S3CVR5_DIACI|nr:cytochrome b-c1 complex subunit 9 [Diaphorina citri]
MALGNTVYNLLFKKTSSFMLTVAVGAFAFERGFDKLTDYVWESHNKGKLWRDIKDKYE